MKKSNPKIRIEKMIMIGSTARSSGKTDLAVQIINTFSRNEKIAGIKITSPVEGDMPGDRAIDLSPKVTYSIRQYFKPEGENTSTDRMLTAGATEAHWLHVAAGFLYKTWDREFYRYLSKKPFIVCESVLLRLFVEPAIFIMIRNTQKGITKDMKDIMELADCIIDYDGHNLTGFDMNRIRIINGKWVYLKDI